MSKIYANMQQKHVEKLILFERKVAFFVELQYKISLSCATLLLFPT